MRRRRPSSCRPCANWHRRFPAWPRKPSAQTVCRRSIAAGLFFLIDPARRHPRVPARQWRIHRQHRAHRQGPPDPGRGPSAGPGDDLCRRSRGRDASRLLANRRRPSPPAPKPADGVIVLASRSHNEGDALDLYLAEMHVAERIAAGSSLKFCRIAEGLADLYPRFGRTMEWDTAAGHAVLAAAGGACGDRRRQAAGLWQGGLRQSRFHRPRPSGT